MRVVAGGFLVLTTSAGLGFYGLAVYLNALSKERGWDIASLSFGTTVFVVAGVTGLWVARFIARRDARLAVLGGGIIGAGSLLALGQITAVWQLYVVYCLYGVEFAAAGLVTVTTVVTRLVPSSSSDNNFSGVTGLSVGGVLITPAAKWFVDEQTLQGAAPWLALVFSLARWCLVGFY